MTDTKLVCFDLDDTLIREIHSVMYLCILNNKLEEIIEIEKREAKGEFSWIEADYHKAKLASGYKIDPNNCIAIGDGGSDIPLFEYCGRSIAINYSNVTLGKATHYIKTDDLTDILNFII